LSRDEKEFVKAITPQSQDFSQWYVDVVIRAELADYAPVRGCIAVRPQGYAIWEGIQSGLDRRFKQTGVMNAYFPMFIPESLFKKEAEHVEGFSPEVPWVTQVGDELLTERLAIRPTSEIIIGSMYSKWIQSYRDLPVLINQWCNVVRWEKATRPFMRTTEFLWQEGHTAHRDEKEARDRTLLMLDVYKRFYEEDLAIPVIAGRKSESEKFAGAVDTYSVEALMRDGRALQAGTSHYLGSGFAEVLDIGFLDSDGRRKFCHQTSWGVSWRSIGAIIMVHGDDRGLVLPPKIAPTQVVIVPIMGGPQKDAVLARTSELEEMLGSRFRVKADRREEYSPGWKFNDWELRGVPIRLEIGPRDLKAGQVVLVRRDTGEKRPVPAAGLPAALADLLDEIQHSLFDRAKAFLEENSFVAHDAGELASTLAEKRGFVYAPWCGDKQCEQAIKAETGATVRNIPFDHRVTSGVCVKCGREAEHWVPFARAY
jgi:prolyl-tRNA synthetase